MTPPRSPPFAQCLPLHTVVVRRVADQDVFSRYGAWTPDALDKLAPLLHARVLAQVGTQDCHSFSLETSHMEHWREGPLNLWLKLWAGRMRLFTDQDGPSRPAHFWSSPNGSYV